MEWETRTLAALVAAEPYPSSSGSGEMVVMVNTEEARTLVTAGAKVSSSGSWNLERNTQHYRFGDKTFFWLAGYGGGRDDDDFPISQDGTRLGVILEDARALG